MDQNGIFHLNENDFEQIALANEWLPKKVIDSHVHVWPNHENVGNILNNEAHVPGFMYHYFKWSMHNKIIKTLFPRVYYISASFGMPHFMSDVEMNDYVLNKQREGELILPVRVDNNQLSYGDSAVQSALKKKFSALKMYPQPGQKNAQDSRISDVFPINKLKEVNRAKSSIILHLPINLLHHHDELVLLADMFDDVTFIIAHCGNFYCQDARLKESLSDDIVRCQNIYFDTAMVANTSVFCELISRVGVKRILYGSDAPFSYIHGRHVIDGERLVLQSATQFSWVRREQYEQYYHLTNTFPLIHMETIRTIKSALRCCFGNENKGKEFIFFNNANKLLGGNRL